MSEEDRFVLKDEGNGHGDLEGGVAKVLKKSEGRAGIGAPGSDEDGRIENDEHLSMVSPAIPRRKGKHSGGESVFRSSEGRA